MESRKEYHKVYDVWSNIKKRCYNKSNRAYPFYGAKGVIMCDEWVDDFQTFYKWYMENNYEIEGEKIVLDKDILGGKIYSPETCVLIPEKLNNSLIHKVDGKMRGVQHTYNKYEVKVRNTFTGKNDYIGRFKTLEQASIAYSEAKNIIFQNLVKEYDGLIPDRIYKILTDFKL